MAALAAAPDAALLLRTDSSTYDVHVRARESELRGAASPSYAQVARSSPSSVACPILTPTETEPASASGLAVSKLVVPTEELTSADVDSMRVVDLRAALNARGELSREQTYGSSIPTPPDPTF